MRTWSKTVGKFPFELTFQASIRNYFPAFGLFVWISPDERPVGIKLTLWRLDLTFDWWRSLPF